MTLITLKELRKRLYDIQLNLNKQFDTHYAERGIQLFLRKYDIICDVGLPDLYLGIIKLAKYFLCVEKDINRIVYMAAINNAPWLQSIIEAELITRNLNLISPKYWELLTEPNKYTPGSLLKPGFMSRHHLAIYYSN